MRIIDDLLNRVTMYRLVVYYLTALIVVAVAFSFMGVLSYDPYALLFSTAFILLVCTAVNHIFCRVYDVPTNVESSNISGLILALIISPINGYGDLWFLFWASVLSIASKYIINLRGKHIFNPVALGVAITYVTINQAASWWIGTPVMLPFVLLGGLLLTHKLRRFQLVASFMIAAIVVTFVGTIFGGQSILQAFSTLFLYSPFLFFAFVMLTEPLTIPPTDTPRNFYGALVGVLFAPAFHWGSLYSTPEIALVIGNLFSYVVSPKRRLILSLKERFQITPNSYDFIFGLNRRLGFAPGQYMEWTLDHTDPDARGNRRFFTMASSPTEPDLRLGLRFVDPSSLSSYKQAMLEMQPGDEIMAGQLTGDFTLPRNRNQALVFIAGGIGITPYRSMIKYLLDIHQPRPITLFYGALTVNSFAYRDIFDQAERELGIHTIYVAEKTENIMPGWVGLNGLIKPEMIQTYAPNYRQSIFYISGPHVMVNSVNDMLHKMGIPRRRIKMDFFAGL
jgi:ferredoxin-NADP reductase/Na+-translocating ferredoxin:NAD+ oxidoreductase RnfD subunit